MSTAIIRAPEVEHGIQLIARWLSEPRTPEELAEARHTLSKYNKAFDDMLDLVKGKLLPLVQAEGERVSQATQRMVIGDRTVEVITQREHSPSEKLCKELATRKGLSYDDMAKEVVTLEPDMFRLKELINSGKITFAEYEALFMQRVNLRVK